MKLLFIVLFVGIISWKGASRLNGGFVFQMGEGFIFKRGHPMGGIGFDGKGFRKKIVRWAGDTMRTLAWSKMDVAGLVMGL